MIVWRIEDKYGQGVFRSDYSPTWIDNTDIDDMPTPFEDTELMEKVGFRPDSPSCVVNEYSFGFKSVDQMLKWFSKEQLKALSELGFNINIYMVDDEHSHSSDYQAMFKKQYAQVVRRMKIEELEC